MSFLARVASCATMTFCAVLMAGATTPGFAVELDRPALASINTSATASVPTPPAPIVPSEWTSESSDEASAPNAALDGRDDEDAEYSSLAAAVADQEVGEALDEELKCLAIGIYYEAKGEPLKGQLAVAQVLLNRTRSGRFPSSVCSVLKQRGQFSFVRGGELPSVDTSRAAWKTAVAVAKVARQQLWDSPVPGALFFHAAHVSPRWRLAKVGSVGNHVFYR